MATCNNDVCVWYVSVAMAAWHANVMANNDMKNNNVAVCSKQLLMTRNYYYDYCLPQ